MVSSNFHIWHTQYGYITLTEKTTSQKNKPSNDCTCRTFLSSLLALVNWLQIKSENQSGFKPVRRPTANQIHALAVELTLLKTSHYEGMFYRERLRADGKSARPFCFGAMSHTQVKHGYNQKNKTDVSWTTHGFGIGPSTSSGTSMDKTTDGEGICGVTRTTRKQMNVVC